MSAEPRYVNFDLLIERQGSDFRARVTDSPAGEAWTRFPPPVQELEVQNLRLLSMGRRTVRAVDAHVETTARDIGERLFRGAFREGVLECYVKSRAWAEHEKVRLRIRLRLADPDVQQLPWEYLRDPNAGGKFLGLDRDTPIVRYMEVAEPKPLLHVEGALRILAVISTPTDLEGLDAEREWRNLQQALAVLIDRKAVSLHRLQPTTFAALEQETSQRDYHVMHFVGHGGYDPQTQDGMLVFTADDGTSQQISSDQLGPIIGDEDTLKLAVLNACEGAVAKGKDIFAGCAQRLVGHGIPAVVAMQAEITDTAAIDFSARFYASLAEGRPVDGALVDARKAIFARPNPVEWGTPVLYMRAGDGRLFEVGTGPAAAAVAPPPPSPAAAPPTPAPSPLPLVAATAQPVVAAPGGETSLVTRSALHPGDKVGFWPRFAAMVIDLVVLIIANQVITGAEGEDVTSAFGLMVDVAYFVGLWTYWGGQSLGKKAMGIKVVKTDGSPVTLSTAIIRYVGYIISAIALLVGFIWIAFDAHKQGWHDKIASTYVVKA